ncbi:efflux RND transporter periplasmic adaptor subunit [Planctopirus hydrillae]|uniref:Efflux transporter periplasmic adaptor subunit n=1 Tax=Planctopirus hydrillae TaxID=1841610 RepID=A0A1C3ETN6_9PLAN|nr:efflux RND transporter periplasmic adaptor subunit [Planctopirus hydrillae]ODA36630.1 hypothetical protein A6X21_15985 [Planctopirus hydrillae]
MSTPVWLNQKTAAITAVLVVALGIAAFVLSPGLRNLVLQKPETHAKTDLPAHNTNAAHAGEAPEISQVDFPQEMWKAAGLVIGSVQKGPLDEAITLTGKISLNEDKLAHVFPLVEGRVDDVRVRFGQKVHQGDLLVVVQSKEVGQGKLQLFQDRLKLEFAMARDRWAQEISQNTLSLIEMIRAEAAIENIENALKERTMGEHRQTLMNAYLASIKAQTQTQRLAPLSGTGAVPAKQLLDAESEGKATKAILQALLEQTSQDVIQASRLSTQSVKELQTTIAVAETNLKILGFNDHDLKEIDPSEMGENLAHYPVVAPFDGTVISKDVVLMERVGPERQILTIADLSTVWVSADIYESHLPILSQLKDQKIRLRSEAWPGRQFEATIFYTGDVVQESTRTLSMRAMAENAEGLLKPGMFVSIELPNLSSSEVLQVPLTALQDFEGKTFVFVHADRDQFVRRVVETGRRNSTSVEILSGLNEGDRVVTDGGFALKSRMLADLLGE